MLLRLLNKACRTAAALALAGATCVGQAQAPAVTVYNLPVAADYTGPLANVIDSWQAGQKTTLDWWNDTRGKSLGVRIDLKSYDTRYDPAVVARLWPEILAKEKPIAYLGLGGADLVALMKRLPTDKVPLFISSAMIAPLWTANGWHFTYRPTYVHEFAGLFNHLQTRLPQRRALRIATIGTQGVPAYVDPINGFVALAKAYPDRFAVVSSQWVDAKPISVVNQVRELAKTNPDIITVHIDTQQASAVLKAMKEIGVKIPIATSSHNGLTELTSSFTMAELEGNYSVFAFAPFNDPRVKMADIFAKYNKGPGKWGMIAAQTSSQMLVFLAAVERAVAAVGPSKLTGQAIYDAMLAKPFEADQFQGLLPKLSFTAQAPFPLDNLSVRAMTIKDGKLISLTDEWLPVPNLTKW